MSQRSTCLNKFIRGNNQIQLKIDKKSARVGPRNDAQLLNNLLFFFFSFFYFFYFLFVCSNDAQLRLSRMFSSQPGCVWMHAIASVSLFSTVSMAVRFTYRIQKFLWTISAFVWIVCNVRLRLRCRYAAVAPLSLSLSDRCSTSAPYSHAANWEMFPSQPIFFRLLRFFYFFLICLSAMCCTMCPIISILSLALYPLSD